MSHKDTADTPLSKKLGFKPGFRAILVNPPEGLEALLAPLPDGVRFLQEPDVADIDLAMVFATRFDAFESGFDRMRSRLKSDGMIWACWPKKSSGVPTELTFEVVQGFGLALGLVDVKVCAVDAVWSGLKFVVRLKDRPKSPMHYNNG